ncbi:MAG: aspartate kinase [Bacteroidota bacterium]|jgi:aspartate kinase
MRVFKFGGASVKDAESVKNVATILNTNTSKDRLCVVVSAMGKTTNLLEEIAKNYFNKVHTSNQLNQLKEYHFSICKNLFSNNDKFFEELHNLFVELEWILEEEPGMDFSFVYDQIVCLGEILSTKIIATYLNNTGLNCNWVDARDLIKTDNTYREGKVDWDNTLSCTKEFFTKNSHQLILTQGFIGGTSENFTTTLGREGSDYSAAILAYCLDAKEVLIWKDVPGVLNADPKYFSNTFVLNHLSYQDTIELAYYGATVIHPKTIKPLQNKNIALKVKSFLSPNLEGTLIDGSNTTEHKPSYIVKRNQVVMSIFPKDFSFIIEDNLSEIFKVFSQKQVKINLMQNSAISFSVCINNDENKIQEVIPLLKNNYKVLFNENLQLITIRYFNEETENSVLKNKEKILEQRSRHTLQVVVKE